MFKCKSFPCLQSYIENKLLDQSTTYIFLGYSQHLDGWLSFDLVGWRLYVSWDVWFLGNKFSMNTSLFGGKEENAPFMSVVELDDYVMLTWKGVSDTISERVLDNTERGSGNSNQLTEQSGLDIESGPHNTMGLPNLVNNRTFTETVATREGDQVNVQINAKVELDGSSKLSDDQVNEETILEATGRVQTMVMRSLKGIFKPNP